MSRRYALYWAPGQGSALWNVGCGILGRDAATGEALLQPDVPDVADLHGVTASPRRYGLHATLKPPFRLAPGVSENMLRAALQAFAAARHPFRLPRLHLAAIGKFLAWTPVEPCQELERLAGACVEEFDRFRAPPSLAEMEKRRSKGLTPRQEALLSRWGYPYVLEEYRFHVTLTGSIDDPAERSACRSGLERLCGPAVQEELARVDVREICLFEEPGQEPRQEPGGASGPEEPFRLTARYPFGGRG